MPRSQAIADAETKVLADQKKADTALAPLWGAQEHLAAALDPALVSL